MIILDTDHLTLVKYAESDRAQRLADRLRALPADAVVAISIVTVEEQMRGWPAAVAKERSARRQVFAYSELTRLLEYFQTYTIASFDDRAAQQFDELRTAKIRLGTMDLKIAATALVNQAILLSANRSDFGRVPGLRVENWLD
ncbi:MAG TPA: type II toxin-antitoxin system VapC family toxin [Gemmataceae bacterium]|nr:type II toxin-antitoxin system VapC family toxin [Gemmataceae bacterium]